VAKKVYKSGWLFCLVLAVLLAGVHAVNLRAATYYVDPIAGDPNNDGSFENPWKTLQEVFDNELIETQVYETNPPGPNTPFVIKNSGAPVKAGDTILLRSGYHGEVVYRGAYNSDFITIAAQEGHVPGLQRIRLWAAGKWILRGLTISPELAPQGYQPNTLISFRDHTTSGPCNDLVVEDCNLYSVQDISTWDANDWNARACTAMRIEAPNSIVRNNTLKNIDFGIIAADDNILVEHNRIEHIAGDGIVGGGDNLVIQFNTIKNFYKVNANHDDGIQFHRGVNIDRIPMRNAVIRGNFIVSHDPNPDNPLLGSPMGICVYEYFPIFRHAETLLSTLSRVLAICALSSGSIR